MSQVHFIGNESYAVYFRNYLIQIVNGEFN
jgi:hypothetical protein